MCGLHRRGVGIAVGLSSEWSRFEEEEEEERGDGTSLWFSVIMAEEREGRRGSWKRRGEMWEPDYRAPPLLLLLSAAVGFPLFFQRLA